MANNCNKCTVCDKNIRKHENILTCSNCKRSCHKLCLPVLDNIEVTYMVDNGWYCSHCYHDIFPYQEVENDIELIEMVNTSYNPLEHMTDLASYLINPYETNGEENIMDEIDPDTNFYTPELGGLMKESKYKTFGSFNKMIDSNNIKENNFSIMHLNIRSSQKI